MKVLWITNTLFPYVCSKKGYPEPVVGGWMYSLLKSLKEIDKSLTFAIVSFDEKEEEYFDGETHYYILPKKGLYSKSWNSIKTAFNPDVVHIHGSEYGYGLSYLNIFGNEKVVLSIQGLVSVYKRYFFAELSFWEILQNITWRDIIRNNTLFNQYHQMCKRSKSEIKMLVSIKNVIGRTSWDYAHSLSVNSDAKYFSCNETLRNEFYSDSWNNLNIESFSIFLSQTHYPIKGFHTLLYALPIILKKFPTTKIYVTGDSFFNKKKYLQNGYQRILHKIIYKYSLENSIIFLGKLSATEMKERYLKSHIFVCPSSIENSPNSIGEAQLLGVPCIASYVGGVPDMVSHNETGLLYRFGDHEMLADKICKIFSDTELAKSISLKSKQVASIRHNTQLNARRMLEIYNEICKK